jgi:hypothetical protein
LVSGLLFTVLSFARRHRCVIAGLVPAISIYRRCANLIGMPATSAA